jgi:hypothetical protein
LWLLNPLVNQKVLVQIKSMNGIGGATELNGKIAVRALDASSTLAKTIRRIERAGGRFGYIRPKEFA